MVAIICILILVLVILLLLLLPIRIWIDTRQQRFIGVSLGKIVHCCGEVSEKGWLMTIHFLGFKKEFNLAEMKSTPANKKPLKKEKKRTRYILSPIHFLQAFRLQKLEWTLDTGDFIHNAQLYPVFGFLSHGNIVLSINFNGQNALVLNTYTRLIYLSAAFIKSRIN
jgi:hypothetical protein